MNTKTEPDMKEMAKRSGAILAILNGLTVGEHLLIILGAIGHVYADLKLFDNKQRADDYLESFVKSINNLYEKKDCIKVSLENKSLNIVVEDLINERNEK